MTHRVAPRARRRRCAAPGRKAGEHKKRRRIETPNPRKARHLGAEAIDPKGATDYFHGELGEPRQGAERPTSACEDSARGDPLNLIQLMLA
jgi:hypothetical protein